MVDLEKVKKFEQERKREEEAKDINPDDEIKRYEEEKAKKAEESKDKTIFDEELSYPDKRLLLEKVPDDSNFMKSYKDFLNQIADYYAKKLPDEIVTFQTVIEEYHYELDVQKENSKENKASINIDLTIFPLEVSDIQKVTTLINRKKD